MQQAFRGAEPPVKESEMAGEASLLVRPTPPVVTDLDVDRQMRKVRLAASFRLFAQNGFENGAAGHAAVRDPARPHMFWTNPFGVPFRKLTSNNLILVDEDGNLAEGEGRINRAAYAIHAKVHEARPDINASIHLHPTAGMAWASLGRKIDPIVQDCCAFFDDHEVYEDFQGAVLDVAEGVSMGKALGDGKALILQNHGLLTVGETIDEASWWMFRLDRCCQVQLLAEAAGTPKLIPPSIARATADVIGTHNAGWFSFQPMLEAILEEQPGIEAG